MEFFSLSGYPFLSALAIIDMFFETKDIFNNYFKPERNIACISALFLLTISF